MSGSFNLSRVVCAIVALFSAVNAGAIPAVKMIVFYQAEDAATLTAMAPMLDKYAAQYSTESAERVMMPDMYMPPECTGQIDPAWFKVQAVQDALEATSSDWVLYVDLQALRANKKREDLELGALIAANPEKAVFLRTPTDSGFGMAMFRKSAAIQGAIKGLTVNRCQTTFKAAFQAMLAQSAQMAGIVKVL